MIWRNCDSQPAKRDSQLERWTTVEAAKKPRHRIGITTVPYEYIYDYEDLNWVRLFLGQGLCLYLQRWTWYQGIRKDLTRRGLISKSMPLRISSEWVNGKRKAYTDRTSNVEIKADWATGNVLWQVSWAGTTTFGVAATGVEGQRPSFQQQDCLLVWLFQ